MVLEKQQNILRPKRISEEKSLHQIRKSSLLQSIKKEYSNSLSKCFLGYLLPLVLNLF